MSKNNKIIQSTLLYLSCYVNDATTIFLIIHQHTNKLVIIIIRDNYINYSYLLCNYKNHSCRPESMSSLCNIINVLGGLCVIFQKI